MRDNPRSRDNVRGSRPVRQSGGRGGARSNVRSNAQALMMVRRLIVIALVIAIALLFVYIIISIPRGATGPITLNISIDDNPTAFNNGMLYMSSGQLMFIDARGISRVLLPLGGDAAYHASGQIIAAWRGSQIYILNAAGDILYNDRTADPISFARVGDAYAAILSSGSDGSQRVTVINHNGSPVWTIDAGTADMLDMVFFGSGSLRLLTIALDTAGASPASIVTSYEPRRYEVTGSKTLYNQLVYKAYPRGGQLALVDAVSLTTYDYWINPVSGMTPVTVYGWQARDIRAGTGFAGGEAAALFTRAGTQGATVRQARLIGGGQDIWLRLPAPCIDVRLGSKGVYAFTRDTVYTAKYGSTTFIAHALSAPIERVMCLTAGDKAAVASGGAAVLMDLPLP